MVLEAEKINTQAQETAFEVNEFYRDNYRRTMKSLVFMVVVCAILSAVLSWMAFDKKQPLYFAAMTTGQVIPMNPLSEPVLTSDFILQWSSLVARRIYNLNFATYQEQLGQVQDKFTPESWEKLMNTLKPGMIKQLLGSKLIITSVVMSAPVIVARMIIRSRFTWRVQIKMLVTYTSASEATKRNILVTMDVQRVPTLNASQGIQIIDFTSGTAG
ncbi:MAG: type IVB secretion system apparatus protein IcmL/DotI [Gammaproteobacteria bacterium]|nr:type IVB secretion system apparatus protein IcmL/DotI [Gammaproteobacteria bacterium]